MSVTGKRVFRSVVDEVIARKGSIELSTARTIRSDSAAILEALVAEMDESTILAALRRQGFAQGAYRPTMRALIKVARERRDERLAGTRGRRP
jgi:hypothetical protein